jgi:hypothetical protein
VEEVTSEEPFRCQQEKIKSGMFFLFAGRGLPVVQQGGILRIMTNTS